MRDIRKLAPPRFSFGRACLGVLRECMCARKGPMWTRGCVCSRIPHTCRYPRKHGCIRASMQHACTNKQTHTNTCFYALAHTDTCMHTRMQGMHRAHTHVYAQPAGAHASHTHIHTPDVRTSHAGTHARHAYRMHVWDLTCASCVHAQIWEHHTRWSDGMLPRTHVGHEVPCLVTRPGRWLGLVSGRGNLANMVAY